MAQVHNHGIEEGEGLACREVRGVDGQLRGACMGDAEFTPTVEALGQALLDIMALHRPEPVRLAGNLFGTCCASCMVPVEDEPCDTVRIIKRVYGDD